MNGTHTTSKPGGIPYTVMGGGRRDRIRKYPYRLTILILNRGDRLFREELLRQVDSLGIGEILWVEGPEASEDLESLSRGFPETRFILIRKGISHGEMINIGISESRAPLVLCMWSDARIVDVSPSLLDSENASTAVCALPVIRNSRSEILPTIQSPVLRRGRLSLRFNIPAKGGEKALFPFDYAGIYHREKFEQVGGFDPTIVNPYWQKLDFGFRCILWGEIIRSVPHFTLLYASKAPVEDATPDEGYKAFYLKNLAVRLKKGIGILPGWRILDYILHSNTDPLYAVKEFRQMREWVFRNRFRFKRDAKDLIGKWGTA